MRSASSGGRPAATHGVPTIAAMPRPPSAEADVRDRSSSLARGAALVAAGLATAAALALAVLAMLQTGTATPPVALPWLLVAGMACTASAVGWALWRQRELANGLRDARLETRGLLDLMDRWHWRSDGAHRLVQLRPPADASAGEWAAADGLGQAVWEHFGADLSSSAELRARLESGARIDGLRVWRRHGNAGLQRVELRAVALSDAHGRSAGYVGSARVLDDDAARDRDQRLLHALLQALPLPVFELSGTSDAPTQVQRGNDAAAQWLGLKPAQLGGLAFTDLQARLPRDLRAAVSEALAARDDSAERAVCAGWEVQARRVEAETPAGAAGDSAEPRWVLTLMPTARTDDAPVAAGETESFSYTVSHDLRAPIRVVEGFTKILKEDYGRQIDRIGNDHLDRVLGAAARMNNMIDALLALSQLSSRPLSRRPVNLSQLAGYVVEELRRQSPGRTVTVQIEAGLQTQGDPTLLRVMLENLLGNAWKYSARRPHAQIWLERGLYEGHPVFTVRDNGAVFDMRFADRLFGVFQRLHSASDFPGSGVGLASVRRIIGRHGGEVWAESVVDRGSSFHFTLPAGDAAA